MTRRKFFHRVIFTRTLAVRVIEIRRVPLLRWPWEQSSFVTVWAAEQPQLFREIA
jgi:hypothetical protein